MADSRLKKALESIGHSELLQKFEDEDMDDEALDICIKDENCRKDLKSIFSKQGTVLKFLSAYKKLRDEADGVGASVQPPNSRSVNPTTCSQQPGIKKPRPGNNQAHSVPEPVQIIDLILKGKSNTDTILVLKEDNLARILKNVKNRRVAVLSIAGPSRQGKSFILSYMIKYLRHISQGVHFSDWMGEGESEREAPLQDAFPWRNGVDPQTTGISMWPEPFTLTSRDGSEFDVLLMDTQGVFDQYTEEKDWATIVGLSLLTSSALIFNISKQLQEDTLKTLKSFMDFGQMAMDSDDSGKAFQSLTFLIRDWNNPGDYKYGVKGGAEFLKYYLNQRHTNGGSEMRDQIKNSFEQVNCFLMPDPGETVKDNNYNGSVDGMAPKFATNIKDFIEFLLNPNTFPVKTISGNPITGNDLSTYFKNYVEIFNSDKVPSSEDMNRAMTTICNTAVLNKCIAAYEATFENLTSQVQRSFLLETELQDIHELGVKDAIRIFDNSRKMGSKFDINKSKLQLQDSKLKGLLDNFTLQNRDMFRTAVNTEVESIKKNFEASVHTQIASHLSTAPAAHKFLSDDSLHKILEECEREAIESFQTNLGLPNLDCVQSDMEGISSAIQTICKSVMQNNESAKSEAESALSTFLQELLDKFSEQLTKETRDKYVETTASEELVDGAFEKIKSEFSEKYQNSLFFQEGEAILLKKVASLRHDFLEKIKTHNNFLSMKCTEQMGELERKYEEEMDRAFESGKLLETFSKCHQDAEKNALESFTNSEFAQKLPAEVLRTFKSDFLSRLSSKAAQFAQRSLNEKKKRLLTQFQESLAPQNANFDLDEDLSDASTLQRLYDTQVNEVMDSFGHLLNDIQSTVIATVDADDGIKTQLLSDINNEIELHRKKHEEKNERLKRKYESQITEILKKSAETYSENIKQKISIESQDQFKSTALAMMEATIADFEKKCASCPNSSTLSPTLLPTFLNNLRAELDRRMNQELELVELKLKQDEAEIKFAIPEIKKAYKDEMEKIFNAKKDKVSFQELRYHHTNISRDVLDKYNRDKYLLPPSRQKEVQEELDVLYKGFGERVKRNKTQIIPAIGIDLGTTYSCVAVIRAGQVEVIKNTLGEPTTASYVHFPEGGGPPVVAGAKDEAYKDPDNTVFDAKRLIGRKLTDVVVQEDMKHWPFKVVNEGNSPKIQIRGRNFDPAQISSFILMYLKQCAEKRLHLPGQIKNAVITVPAYFSDAQRQATKDAGEIAGLNVLKIINEPTAAAIAYGLDFHDDLHKNVLIFDLGGGTFDVAVLNMKKGDINVKAIGGDTHLGGEDFDNQLVTYCLEEFRRKTGVDLLSVDHTRNRVLRRLRNECERMKRQLSEKTAVNIRVEKIKDNHDLDVSVRRETFERLCAPMFQKCITEVDNTLKDAKLDKTEIDDVVLVGGSTRIPKIIEMIGKYFNGKVLRQTKSSDEIVAHGAAILACSLNPGQDENEEFDLQLREVTPFSLGTDTLGDNLSIIIPKNSSIPSTQTQTYVTVFNSQTSVDVVIYEGENPKASKNRVLGKFLLKGIPPAPAGQEKCTVTMDLSSENILTVTAMGVSKRNRESIKIESHTGRLNRKEIEAMKSENVKASRKTTTGPRKVPPHRQPNNHEDDEGNDSDW